MNCGVRTDEMEARVRERTADLGKANQALEGEIAVRSGVEEALSKERTILRSLIRQRAQLPVHKGYPGQIRCGQLALCAAAGF